MNEPTHLPRLVVELTLRTTELGGRRSGVTSGYRSQWLLTGIRDFSVESHEDVVFNDCTVHFDVPLLEPGQCAVARAYPIHPEFWREVHEGQTLGLYEGWRAVGFAKVRRTLPA